MRVIISGGGTGGHVYPAIAIANSLSEKGVKDILFVGAKGKLEMEKVPKAGYPIEGLDIQGFHRKKMWRNVMFPFRLIGSLLKSRKIIDKFGPDIVVGVGGYASGSVLRVAQSRGIPTVLQEQNSLPGVTNKWLAKKATQIFVAYPDMDRFFDSDKILITGNPVRNDLLDESGLREEAMRHFGLDSKKKTIFITGGSLGARQINKAVAAQESVLKESDCQLIWQVGKIYHEEYATHPLAHLPQVKLLSFVDRMDLAYAAADVVVCRAGALTLSELMIVGKPCVLVPSPNVAEDHQTKNAMALVNNQAGKLVKDEEAHIKMIPEALVLLNDVAMQKLYSDNIRKMAAPEAASTIADSIIKIVQK